MPREVPPVTYLNAQRNGHENCWIIEGKYWPACSRAGPECQEVVSAMRWVCAVRLHCQISNNVSLDSCFIWPQQTTWWQTIEWDMRWSQFHQIRQDILKQKKRDKKKKGNFPSPWNLRSLKRKQKTTFRLLLRPIYVHVNSASHLWCCLRSKWKVFVFYPTSK